MAASRASQVREAVRPAMKARLMVAGPAGSGKTFSSLVIATTLAEGAKFVLIDTEEESALTYADRFSFVHLPWQPPYNALELAATIGDLARQYPVIVIDSLTHFWRGDGGILDKADGKFGGWKVARPAHDDMVKAILRSPAHMIVCVRSKMAYEQAQNEKTGKLEVNKLGLAPQQDSDLEYEMNVSVEVSTEHQIDVGKSRCEDLAGRTFQPGHAADLASAYGQWLKGGEPVVERAIVDALTARMNAIADPDRRKECKREFMAMVGRPEYLRQSRTADVEAIISRCEQMPDVPAAPPAAAEAPSSPPPGVLNANGQPLPPSPGSVTPPASRFHKRGGAMGLSEDERRAIVRVASKGRTTSAAELTPEELFRAFKGLDAIELEPRKMWEIVGRAKVLGAPPEAPATHTDFLGRDIDANGRVVPPPDPFGPLSEDVGALNVRYAFLTAAGRDAYAAGCGDDTLPAKAGEWTADKVTLAAALLDEIEADPEMVSPDKAPATAVAP